jgi:16S rRNA (uracil1498-N3)-methyltransferase
VIRVPLPTLSEGDVSLTGSTFRYVARVLRLREGDAFVAFDPEAAREADAIVLAVEREAVRVRLGAARPARAVAPRDVTWIQGLAKGDKNDAIVRDATELAATRVWIAEAARSVARGAEKREDRWRRIAREASRQCGRGDAPAIEVIAGWNDAIARVPPDAARFCLYERATEPLAPPLLEALHGDAPLAFAVGPEGGLADDEVARARSLGWTVASLGALTLRTETVAAAVLGAVCVWSGLRGA